jgi:hypothetical protein
MPIAKITGKGLAAIAVAVAMLWACLISERLMLDRSYARRAQVMRDLRRMQVDHGGMQPASAPSYHHRPSTTVS